MDLSWKLKKKKNANHQRSYTLEQPPHRGKNRPTHLKFANTIYDVVAGDSSALDKMTQEVLSSPVARF